jgi:molybdate transport system permease protein
MSFRRISIGFSFFTFSIYGVLIASLFYFFRGSTLLETLASERMMFSVRLSIFAATVSTLLSILIAVPSAFALSRYEFRGRTVVDTILELPMIVSPAALGAMLLIFFNNPAGEWIQDHWTQFVFTSYGIVLAQFVTICGVSTRLIKAAMDEIPIRYEAVARTLGASPAKAFLTITLPLSRRGIYAACILSWAKALGEFGATITIAGSMAMKTETLPIAIFMKLSSAEIEGTVVLILILLCIGLGILYLVRLLSRSATYV